jgi:hypothetical protein
MMMLLLSLFNLVFLLASVFGAHQDPVHYRAPTHAPTYRVPTYVPSVLRTEYSTERPAAVTKALEGVNNGLADYHIIRFYTSDAGFSSTEPLPIGQTQWRWHEVSVPLKTVKYHTHYGYKWAAHYSANYDSDGTWHSTPWPDQPYYPGLRHHLQLTRVPLLCGESKTLSVEELDAKLGKWEPVEAAPAPKLIPCNGHGTAREDKGDWCDTYAEGSCCNNKIPDPPEDVAFTALLWSAQENNSIAVTAARQQTLMKIASEVKAGYVEMGVLSA